MPTHKVVNHVKFKNRIGYKMKMRKTKTAEQQTPECFNDFYEHYLKVVMVVVVVVMVDSDNETILNHHNTKPSPTTASGLILFFLA